MKLTMPMTANLASVESIGELPSASSSGVVTGSTSDESMQAPMAATNGASFESSARQVLYLSIFLFVLVGNVLVVVVAERKEDLRVVR